jgi:N-methylhydantoinase A/oxoprolinase/acetone carboxylase beta subunit
MGERPIRIGVDIGGTFTDLQILDARSGAICAFKLATTPEDPSLGLMEGIRAAAARFGFALDDVGYILHGTTIATNAVLERKLARGALVTTAGFEDVLEIGRHNRREVYAIWPRPVPALIPRDRRLGIGERMRADGTAERAPDGAAIEAVIRRLAGLAVEAVAVSLLNAYANPAHEEIIARAIERALPGLAVSRSSAVSPEIREYERTSTTVLNALLQPVVQGYLAGLERRMRAERFAPRLLIVQSNGGVCSPATAAAEPVRLLLSGPSGGAMAALALSRALGEANVVGVDMGGTSFDVSVVREDRLEVVTQSEIDRLPVRMPMIEIRTIGAGGGSLARVAGGRLSVGPESAGARPGPVCYRRGGRQPTVTDANLVLGRLDGATFLGGAMALDVEAAARAIETEVAAPLGLTREAAAVGILRITDTSLAAAIRVSLFEKGLDPRDFALLSFGGAGSVHACAVAGELAMRRIVFPVDASTLSARGILDADIRHAFARSAVRRFDADALPVIAAIAADLQGEADARLAADGIAEEQRRHALLIDLRYKGQAFELTVPWAEEPFDPAGLARVALRFHDQHERRFSYASRADVVEMVTLRLAATGLLPRTAAAPPPGADARPPTLRRVFLDEVWREIPVWQRSAIRDGDRLEGPLIIEEPYTTIYLAPGWRLARVAGGHLLAEQEGARP